jgi:hypothetical protein
MLTINQPDSVEIQPNKQSGTLHPSDDALTFSYVSVEKFVSLTGRTASFWLWKVNRFVALVGISCCAVLFCLLIINVLSLKVYHVHLQHQTEQEASATPAFTNDARTITLPPSANRSPSSSGK